MEGKHPNILNSFEKVVNSSVDMGLGIPAAGPLLRRLREKG